MFRPLLWPSSGRPKSKSLKGGEDKIDVATKPTNVHNRIQVYYIINLLFLLHVSTSLVAILRKANYNGLDMSRCYENLSTIAHMQKY